MCETCKMMADYEVGGDDNIAVLALPSGNAMVASRHHAKMENLLPEAKRTLLRTANEISVIMYESLQVHGTNIIGVDDEHARYAIIGREENDAIELKWEPKRASPAELTELSKKISSETWSIGKKDFNEQKNPFIEERAPSRIEPEAVPIQKPKELVDPDMTPPGDGASHGLDDVAAEIQKKVKQGPTEERDYRIRHLTRRR